MTEKLTIIVTCTDRKSLPVVDALRVRHLPPGSMEKRSQRWADELTRSGPRRPLRSLYQGETWTQALRLEEAARAAGYEPRLLVASAGLGLRSAEFAARAYGATFSPASPDVVGIDIDQSQDWWRLLHTEERTRLDGPMLWVLSKSYADVIADDLLKHATTTPLIFGGSDRIDPAIRVPSDRALRRSLGGTATSLNARMAIQWLTLAAQTGLYSETTRERWHEWSTGAAHEEIFDRVPLSDAAIIDFIHALRRRDHGLSKTRALRQLRDAGHACEQRRFGALFNEAGTLR